jgi:hypothetical protein
VLYKFEGATPIPLDTVKEEIRNQVQQQKRKTAIDALMHNRQGVLNNAYFEAIRATAGSATVSPHGMKGNHQLPPHAMPEAESSAEPTPAGAPPATSPQPK